MENLLDFILIYIIFKISLNVSQNFGIKNRSDRTECKMDNGENARMHETNTYANAMHMMT